MDQKQCGECQLVINELEPLRCGFCETFYHISQQCCGINIRNLKEPLSAGKILFVCNSCRGVLQGRSIRCFIDDQQQQQMQPPSLASLPDQVRQLHDAVAELSKKVDNFSANPQRNPSLSATPVWPKPGAKRRREDRPDIDVPTVNGTKTIDLSGLSVPSIAPSTPPEKFWLYLSRLNPLITDNDVQSIVSRCLSLTEPVDVVRLVPRGKVVSSMTFVSFKIGLDPCLKDAALDPDSWPAGLQFREFIDSAKN
ncbi:uncharacterized protein LOC135699359 [Ochlerotatus camptorhynchus]|uniref:uncharacterized protein LOC135699359 n=1 Tax=Ochlerotatus camptorhynchus TaxID=644619 RepID=UPI0031CE04F6